MSELSRRYAKAFYELALESGKEKDFFQQLQFVKQVLFEDPQVKVFFQWPLVKAFEKEELFKKAISGRGLHVYVESFVLFLIKKNRFMLFEEIISCYQFYRDIKKGLLRGTLEGAKLLEEGEKKEFEEVLSKMTKKKVILSQKQNSNCVGGVLVKIQGRVFNDTVLFHLEKLNKQFNRRVEQLWN